MTEERLRQILADTTVKLCGSYTRYKNRIYLLQILILSSHLSKKQQEAFWKGYAHITLHSKDGKKIKKDLSNCVAKLERGYV